jgi:hypothetical protein
VIYNVVTFDPVPLYIICVRLGPSIPGVYVNPGFWTPKIRVLHGAFGLGTPDHVVWRRCSKSLIPARNSQRSGHQSCQPRKPQAPEFPDEGSQPQAKAGATSRSRIHDDGGPHIPPLYVLGKALGMVPNEAWLDGLDAQGDSGRPIFIPVEQGPGSMEASRHQ